MHSQGGRQSNNLSTYLPLYLSNYRKRYAFRVFTWACVLAIAITIIAVQGMNQRLTWFLGVLFAVLALVPDKGS